MNKKIELEINDKLYDCFYDILVQAHIKMEEIFYSVIERTIRENNIDWVVVSRKGELNGKNAKKNNAIRMFQNRHPKLQLHNTSFATKNINQDFYWINPNKKMIGKDWYIILNDNIKRKLYLFYIAKEKKLQFIPRSDTPQKLDIAVKYNDIYFSEIKSGIRLREYLIDEIDYKSLS